MALIVTPQPSQEAPTNLHLREAYQPTQDSQEASPQETQDSRQESPQVPSPPPSQEPADQSDAEREAARKAYALRKLERDYAAKQAALKEIEEREARLKEKEASLKELDEADELAILEKTAKKRGISLEDLLRRGIARMANNGKATPEMELQEARDLARKASEEAKAIREELAKQAQQRQEEEAYRAQAQMIADYRDAAVDAVDANHHPFLSTYESDYVAEQALKAADAYAAKTGEVPDVSDILDYLENMHRSQFEQRAAKTGYSKAQQVLDAKEEPRDEKGRFQPRSASNSLVSARGTAPIDYRKLSPRERARAAAAEVFGKK